MWGVRNNRDIFVHLVLHGRSGIARKKRWMGAVMREAQQS